MRLHSVSGLPKSDGTVMIRVGAQPSVTTSSLEGLGMAFLGAWVRLATQQATYSVSFEVECFSGSHASQTLQRKVSHCPLGALPFCVRCKRQAARCSCLGSAGRAAPFRMARRHIEGMHMCYAAGPSVLQRQLSARRGAGCLWPPAAPARRGSRAGGQPRLAGCAGSPGVASRAWRRGKPVPAAI